MFVLPLSCLSPICHAAITSNLGMSCLCHVLTPLCPTSVTSTWANESSNLASSLLCIHLYCWFYVLQCNLSRWAWHTLNKISSMQCFPKEKWYIYVYAWVIYQMCWWVVQESELCCKSRLYLQMLLEFSKATTISYTYIIGSNVIHSTYILVQLYYLVFQICKYIQSLYCGILMSHISKLKNTRSFGGHNMSHE